MVKVAAARPELRISQIIVTACGSLDPAWSPDENLLKGLKEMLE